MTLSYAADSRRIADFIVPLYGEDPFGTVREDSEAHRQEHARALPGGEQECGVYPSGQMKMRFFSALARAVRPRRILEIGGGLGYSALWLSAAAGPASRVESIDRFPEHVALARKYAERFGLAERIAFLAGEGVDVLPSLAGPYDLVHDDGWFARQPLYFDDLVRLLRPGGLLLISNWFLLAESLTDEQRLDWSQFAGPAWAEDVLAYARALAARQDLQVSFVPDPGVAVAVKLP